MLRVRHLMMRDAISMHSGLRDAISMQFIRGNLRPSVVLGGVHRHLMRYAISMQFRGVHRYRRRRETRQTVNGRCIRTDGCWADVDVIWAAGQRVAVEQHPHVVWACMHGAVAHLELRVWARTKPRGGMCRGLSMDHAHLPN